MCVNMSLCVGGLFCYAKKNLVMAMKVVKDDEAVLAFSPLSPLDFRHIWLQKLRESRAAAKKRAAQSAANNTTDQAGESTRPWLAE